MSDVKLGLEKTLKERNRSIYWLAKETKVAYSTLYRMTKSADVKTVDLDVLQAVCTKLDCNVQDIIPIKP
jgi:DNA-binding Xre family transcriptional regulator